MGMHVPDFITIHGHKYYLARNTFNNSLSLLSAGHFTYDEATEIGSDACEALGVSRFTLRGVEGVPEAAVIKIPNVKLKEVFKWQA